MEQEDVVVVEVPENFHSPRRSLRLALSEVNEQKRETPKKSTSPDEMIIVQRGPRRKPITWSPVEYSRTKILQQSRERTPEPAGRKSEINPRLKRRLVLSPTKGPSQDVNMGIAKRIKELKNARKILN